MKKFHVFTFNEYYPNGGINDYVGSFKTLAEAKITASARGGRDYCNIVETQEDGSLRSLTEKEIFE